VLVASREGGTDDSVLSSSQLRDQVVTLIFANHETTASTLALSLYELSRHEQIRERFHAEVDALSPPLTCEDLDSLSVTERVVTETLRMYPPIYRRSRPSDSGLDPEGEGRKPY
jgi:cytochrome P450